MNQSDPIYQAMLAASKAQPPQRQPAANVSPLPVSR